MSTTTPSIEIQYLADCPELIPLLATWFYTEWGTLSVEQFERRLHERLNRDHLPLVFVSFRDGQPFASASLKIQEMDIRPRYLHWLGSVYVRPEDRNQGIGSFLIEHTAREAQRLGVEDLYLYSTYRERLYFRLGWNVIERVDYDGHPVVIMKRALKRIQPSRSN